MNKLFCKYVVENKWKCQYSKRNTVDEYRTSNRLKQIYYWQEHLKKRNRKKSYLLYFQFFFKNFQTQIFFYRFALIFVFLLRLFYFFFLFALRPLWAYCYEARGRRAKGEEAGLRTVSGGGVLRPCIWKVFSICFYFTGKIVCWTL